ncbi:MAG: hypothetical protein RLZZ458_689 [Planctomycetota bacterium]
MNPQALLESDRSGNGRDDDCSQPSDAKQMQLCRCKQSSNVHDRRSPGELARRWPTERRTKPSATKVQNVEPRRACSFLRQNKLSGRPVAKSHSAAITLIVKVSVGNSRRKAWGIHLRFPTKRPHNPSQILDSRCRSAVVVTGTSPAGTMVATW